MNSQESQVISDLVSRFQQVGVVVESRAAAHALLLWWRYMHSSTCTQSAVDGASDLFTKSSAVYFDFEINSAKIRSERPCEDAQSCVLHACCLQGQHHPTY